MSKNNFLDSFSFIANWKSNFSSFFYEQSILAPKSVISTGARVSENWRSTVDYWKWSSLGSELTLIDGILSKLLFEWVKKRFTLHYFLIWNKMKKHNLICNILKSSYFHQFCRVCPPQENDRRKGNMQIFVIWNMHAPPIFSKCPHNLQPSFLPKQQFSNEKNWCCFETKLWSKVDFT